MARQKEHQDIEIARRLAKELTKKNDKSHTQNLHEIAKTYGYKTWDSMIKDTK